MVYLDLERFLKKILSVTDGIKLRPFNITQSIPMAPKRNDQYIKDDMSTIEKLSAYIDKTLIYRQYLVKILENADLMDTRKAIIHAISLHINGLLGRKTFAYVQENEIPKSEIFLEISLYLQKYTQALQMNDYSTRPKRERKYMIIHSS